ncbi:hypothetical protein ACE38W_05905 [Chitinophaga sp. Hz27]|uniref:hypothetical protein n=1 Tax=Chitinophaga sp. Hz27 TaxID=3347169 RepID=UPI0035DA6844
MKSIPIEDIRPTLESALNSSIPVIMSIIERETSYNKYLDGVSYMLVGLLQIHLRQDGNEWDKAKWMDDCLITDIWITDQQLSLGGIAIWGVGGTTEEWTEPFFFEIALTKGRVDFSKYLFLFGDMNKEAVSYSRFDKKRHIWDQDNRDWQYIIEVG